ncbi:hypothetical protein H1R20_g11663, partial [Candolleomyces eurysporus]
MAKKTAFTPKAPVEKLPLAVRKDIRDNYDSKKEEYETQISELLGTKFTINISPQELWAYVDGFISGLKNFLENYEDEGKTYFNKVVTQSELTVAVNPQGDDAQTISADIKDGVFRILFKHDKLGYNQSWLDKTYFVKAVDAVTEETFSLKAKSSIEKEWEENVDDLKKEIGEVLNLPDVILDPNFEEVYAALKAAKKDDDDWQASFGTAILAYFRDGLLYNLKYAGFKEDDMLQEGLAEAVPSKTIKFRIVKALKSGPRNEAQIEEGILYLQVKPETWYSNVSDMADNIMKLL